MCSRRTQVFQWLVHSDVILYNHFLYIVYSDVFIVYLSSWFSNSCLFCIFFMFQWFTPLLYTTHDVSLIHVFYFHNYHDVSVIHVFLHMFMMFQWFMSICICSWCFSDSCKIWNFSDSCLFAYITCCFSDLCHYKITFYDASLIDSFFS